MEYGSHPPDVTGGYGSTNSLQSQDTSSQDSVIRESMSTEWTDEKHSLYIKSMEASFVNDLYDSVDLLGWPSQRDHSSDPISPGEKHANPRICSGQFKVLRRGCWEEVIFGRHRPQLDKADGSHVLLANPWIRHFSSTCRQQILTSSDLQEKAAFESPDVCGSGNMALTSAELATNLKQFPISRSSLCRNDSVGSNTEGTDQNFADENSEGEKANYVRKVKRRRTSGVTTSSNDQVVP